MIHPFEDRLYFFLIPTRNILRGIAAYTQNLARALVRRGEILLDFDMLDEWEEELKKMNQSKEGKKGARFRYPEPFMRLLAYLHVLFHLPFRQEEGFVKSLSRYVDGLKAPQAFFMDIISEGW